MICRKLVGVYEVEGSIQRNRGPIDARIQDDWSRTLAISIFLGASR